MDRTREELLKALTIVNNEDAILRDQIRGYCFQVDKIQELQKTYSGVDLVNKFTGENLLRKMKEAKEKLSKIKERKSKLFGLLRAI